MSAPRVAVREGTFVLEHYDDLSSDQEEEICGYSHWVGDARDSREVQSPRVAVLGRNPDHEPDEDDPPGDQKKIRDFEVYAQTVLSQGLRIDESVLECLFA